MIVVANAKIKLVLSESSQYSERENRIHHHYLLTTLCRGYAEWYAYGA